MEVVVDKKRRIVYQKRYEKNINENTYFLKDSLFDEEPYTPESYLEGKRVREKIVDTYYWYKIYHSIIGKEKERCIIHRDTYFLASYGVLVCTGDDLAEFGPGIVDDARVFSGGIKIFSSWGNCFIYRSAVRPILYLKSDETFNSLLSGKKDDTSNVRDSFSDKNEVTSLEVENLLKNLEEKRQEKEEIIRQIKELIK